MTEPNSPIKSKIQIHECGCNHITRYITNGFPKGIVDEWTMCNTHKEEEIAAKLRTSWAYKTIENLLSDLSVSINDPERVLIEQYAKIIEDRINEPCDCNCNC